MGDLQLSVTPRAHHIGSKELPSQFRTASFSQHTIKVSDDGRPSASRWPVLVFAFLGIAVLGASVSQQGLGLLAEWLVTRLAAIMADWVGFFLLLYFYWSPPFIDGRPTPHQRTQATAFMLLSCLACWVPWYLGRASSPVAPLYIACQVALLAMEFHSAITRFEIVVMFSITLFATEAIACFASQALASYGTGAKGFTTRHLLYSWVCGTFLGTAAGLALVLSACYATKDSSRIYTKWLYEYLGNDRTFRGSSKYPTPGWYAVTPYVVMACSAGLISAYMILAIQVPQMKALESLDNQVNQ